ncbi:MAG: hypothetical protein L0338_21690 [Acidobacteria bacterium]|nr:hypothetical protein [Acidobacteriota bacterium]
MAEHEQACDQDERDQDELFRALQIASEYYRHGEMLVQSRMYNFLFAVSVLLLGWATLYSKEPPSPTIILQLFAGTALFISLAFSAWGRRAEKFQALHRDRILALESKLPEPLKIMNSIAQLQQEGSVRRRWEKDQKKEIRFRWYEKHARAGFIAVGAPLALAIVSFVLLVLSP